MLTAGARGDHDNWDMALIVEDDGHAVENALSLLQEDCQEHDESEFRTSKQVVNRDQLEALPETFGDLSQLRILDVSRNDIIDLPDSFGRLIALEEL